LHEPSQQHGIVNFFQDGHYGQDWNVLQSLKFFFLSPKKT
jgi:hypothetical protein